MTICDVVCGDILWKSKTDSATIERITPVSEVWRNKAYYPKRVLVETARILDNPFDATIICLEGAELELLRNLCQYLHRRSTFVSEYHDAHYVAPSELEWDELEAIVANLEEKLMGCTEIKDLLEAILVQVTCTCAQTTASLQNDVSVPDYGPSLQPAIDGYITSGAMQIEDDYWDDTAVDVDRCPIAQLVFWQAWEFTTEIMQPVAKETIDILLPLAMAALAASCGTVILAIPAGIVLALLWKLIEIDVAESLINVQNAMWSYKQELICSIWGGLATDYRAAEERATETIANMAGLSALDKVALRMMFSPWAIGLCAKAWTNQTAWALANVDPGACATCAWWSRKTWAMPPCPGIWTGTFACSDKGRTSVRDVTWAISETFTLPDILTNMNFHLEAKWSSAHPAGWTVGWIRVQYQDAGLNWVNIGTLDCTNNTAAGGLNEREVDVLNAGVARNVIRVRIEGQPGQPQTDPWPCEVSFFQMTVEPV